MLTNLLVWLFALYGVVSLFWQCVHWLQQAKRASNAHPVAFILIVQDAEERIEGLLRCLLLRTANAVRSHSICLLDLSESRDTEHIVKRLSLKSPFLSYEHVTQEEELNRIVARICAESSAIGCIYDLRKCDMIEDISRDMVSMCRAK